MIPLRDENPTRSLSFITVALIGVNSAIFIYELSLGNALETTLRHLAVIPNDFIKYINPFQLFTLFSSMFFHGSLLHLAGNMLYLWIFGNNIEDILGHFRFLIYYLLCGITASLIHILIQPSSSLPTIGASGAISGILGAYLILFPKARIIALIPVFLFRLIKIPAFIFIGLWIVIQILSGISDYSLKGASLEGGIAWFSHIGGFFAGIILLPLFYLKKNTP